jgi:thiamine monophosphate synthase
VAASAETGEAAVETVSEGSGVVRLLEKEPTKAERYAHAAELLAIIQRADAQAATQQLDRVALTTA